MDRVRLNAPLVIFDAAVVLASYLIALVLRFSEVPNQQHWNGYQRFVLVVIALHLVCNWAMGLYGQMWRHASVLEARRVLLAGLFSLIGVMTIDVFVIRTKHYPLPLSVLVIGCGLSLAGFGAIRFQSRLFAFRRREQDAHPKIEEPTRALLMGVGNAGARVLADIVRDRSMRLVVVGLVDDDRKKQNLSLHGVTVLGGRDAIPELARRLEVDQVLLTIPSITSDVLQEVASMCEQADVSLRVLPTLSEIVSDQVSAGDLREPRIEDLLGRRQIALDLGSVSNLIRGRRVLITGAGGSIGSEIAMQVARFNPSDLILLDNDETHLHDLRESLGRQCTEVLADVRDRARVFDVFGSQRPEVVFHAAAHKHVPILESHPQEALATNVLGTSNVVDAVLASGVDRFVLISTDKAVRPVSVMGGSKRLAEDIVRSQQGRGTVMSVVRFGNVLGSRGSVVPTFSRQIHAGGPVTVTDPEMTRYFMSLHEAVELVLEAAAIAVGGEVLTLDMGEPVNILQLARRMIRMSGRVPYRDIPIVVTGRRPGEKLHEELIDPEEPQIPSGHPGISLARPLPPDVAALRRRVSHLQVLASEGDLLELAEALRDPGRIVDVRDPIPSPVVLRRS